MLNSYVEVIQTTIYYVILYAIVLIINFFKLKREYKRDPDTATPQMAFPWKRVFFISNEIIYTASGVYIILLDHQKDWIAPIVGVLLLLTLVSTNLDSMSDKFSDNWKLFLHVCISLVVIGGTVLTFMNGLDKSPEESEADRMSKDSVGTYIVSIPYCDKTLIRHLGYDKFGEKFLNYIIEVRAINEKIAIKNALSCFWNDTLIVPILEKSKCDKKTVFTIDEDDVVVQKEKN